MRPSIVALYVSLKHYQMKKEGISIKQFVELSIQAVDILNVGNDAELLKRFYVYSTDIKQQRMFENSHTLSKKK
jgi:hypothetical protein